MANRNRTLKHLYDNNISNTVFLAGDSHQNWVRYSEFAPSPSPSTPKTPSGELSPELTNIPKHTRTGIRPSLARRETIRPGDGGGGSRGRVRGDGGQLDGVRWADRGGARRGREPRRQQHGAAVAGRLLPRLHPHLGGAGPARGPLLRVPQRRVPERVGPAASQLLRRRR